MTEWLVPFKGRNPSGTFRQNFVWRRQNIYIMDNHRAALWCWLQHVGIDQAISLFHIDRHTDTLYSNIAHWTEACPDVRSLGLNDYLEFQTRNSLGHCPLFSWDNYLSIFLEKYAKNLQAAHFATHKEGDPPRLNHYHDVNPWELPENLGYWIEQSDSPAIVNIDLDYFFCNGLDDEYIRFLDDRYIRDVFKNIANQLAAKRISVLTICLSPECCGGWRQAEEICSIACKELSLDFQLPKNLSQ